MHQFLKARTAPISNYLRFRSILIFSLVLSLTGFMLFKNGGTTNARSVSAIFEHGPLAPQANAWVDHQNASVVLGQAAFNTNAAGSGLNQMSTPYGVTVDAATGKVFVVDVNNNRVLRFSSAAAMTNGSTAEAVFGGTGATSATTMNAPKDVSIDPTGNLWVADQTNNRVLRFGGAAALASGAPADVVLGQPNLSTNAAFNPPTASSMLGPQGLFADAGGRLWVADSGNNRVLRFDAAATLASGAAANGVLGQAGFITKVAAVTQNGMTNPFGVTFDSGGHLWVAELNNNRVLRFDAAAGLTNGANASGVLGQSGFTSSAVATTQSGMNSARGVAVDSSGRLYVSDYSNNRVLIFNAAATLANGANASNVLGQPDFTTATSNNGGISASSLFGPRHLFFDNASQNLFVADSNNNRVFRFVPAGPTAAGVSVSGRVMTSDRRGLRNATVMLIDEKGVARRERTGSLGSYIFANVSVGQTYVMAVESNTYRYSPRLISLDNAMSGLDFVPTSNAKGQASAPVVLRPLPTRH